MSAWVSSKFSGFLPHSKNMDLSSVLSGSHLLKPTLRMSTPFVPDSMMGNNMGNGFTVVTHVIPARPTSTLNGALIRTHVTNGAPTGMTQFSKHHPKALGTVQIIVGVMSFLMGVVLSVTSVSLSGRSFVLFWGSSVYISAGALSVAAERFHPCVVKSSLGVNIGSTVTAGITVVLLSLDLAYGLENRCYDFNGDCRAAERILSGIIGVLLVFSLLLFVISICMALFSWDAAFHSEATVELSHQQPNTAPSCPGIDSLPAAHNQECVYSINPYMNHTVLQNPACSPPEYTETVS